MVVPHNTSARDWDIEMVILHNARSIIRDSGMVDHVLYQGLIFKEQTAPPIYKPSNPRSSYITVK